MSIVIGGLVLKNGATFSDSMILAELKRDKYVNTGEITMEEVTSIEFEGIGIARFNSMTIIFERDLPFSCSFEEKELSKLDERLEVMSNESDILCFLIHGLSATYCWSFFRYGKRTRATSSAEGKILSDFGPHQDFETGMQINEEGCIKLLENFIGYSYIDLIFKKKLAVRSYNQ